MLTSQPPVFILSAQRSGSTLLRLTLGKIPGVLSLPETFFWVFKRQHARLDLRKAADRCRLAEEWVAFHRIRKWPVDLDALKRTIAGEAETWKSVLELTIARYVADVRPDLGEDFVWCEKSPPHIFSQDEILADYPNARFIYLVRDPRDVAASLKTCPWSTSNVYTTARVWRKGVRQIGKNPNSLVLRYETMVQEPEQTLRQVCALLGRPYAAEYLHQPTRDAVEEGNVRSGNALKPVSSGHMGKWQLGLSAQDCEAQIIQTVCKKEMEQFGYKPEPFGRGPLYYVHYFHKWLGLALVNTLPERVRSA